MDGPDDFLDLSEHYGLQIPPGLQPRIEHRLALGGPFVIAMFRAGRGQEAAQERTISTQVKLSKPAARCRSLLDRAGRVNDSIVVESGVDVRTRNLASRRALTRLEQVFRVNRTRMIRADLNSPHD
jgi:hypothetical protein